MYEDKKVFAKIPNNLFYNHDILIEKGWRNSILIYFLLTSRKNMNNDVYITVKEINNIFSFNSNVTRAKDIVIHSLEILKKHNLISCQQINYSNGNTIKLKWNKLYPDYGGEGWTRFYADDFEMHKEIGNIPYLVMWVLRMYENHLTRTSFISITDITTILECNRNTVQDAINLFKEKKIFAITEGEYYFNDDLQKNIRKNNQYKYISI